MGGAATSPDPAPQSLWQRAERWWPRRWPRRTPNGICLSRRHELRARLQHIGPLAVERVALPGSPEPLFIRHTADFERLLTNSVYDFTTDYMPNWAEIWPCGVVMAGVVAAEPGVLRGTRVLELGPGAGVTAVAALKAGADLVVADYDDGSLALTCLNALDQTGREPVAVHLNWRQPSRDFFTFAGDGFPLVIGADLLYEYRDVRPLATLLGQAVLPGGELWLGESGREAAKRLVTLLRQRGWTGQSEDIPSPRPDPNYHTWDTITVHRLRRPR